MSLQTIAAIVIGADFVGLAIFAWLAWRAPVIVCSHPHCGGCGGSCPFKISDSRESNADG